MMVAVVVVSVYNYRIAIMNDETFLLLLQNRLIFVWKRIKFLISNIEKHKIEKKIDIKNDRNNQKNNDSRDESKRVNDISFSVYSVYTQKNPTTENFQQWHSDMIQYGYCCTLVVRTLRKIVRLSDVQYKLGKKYTKTEMGEA